MSMGLINSFMSKEKWTIMWKLLKTRALHEWILFIILGNKHMKYGKGNERSNTFKLIITEGKTLLKHIPHESHYNSCKLCLLVLAKFQLH